MLALRWTGLGCVGLEDVPRPRLVAAEDVRVAVEYAAVCTTSDIYITRGVFGGQPPRTLGHEVAGVVAETSSGVGRLRPGDRVVLEPTVACGTCPPCREGDSHLCPNRRFPGLGLDGGCAEEMVAPERNWVPVPDGLPSREACLAEPLACVLHALDRLGPQPGWKVGIVGGGLSACLFLLALVREGVRPEDVLVGGRRGAALDSCSGAGAKVVDTSEIDFSAACRAVFAPKGPDVIILQMADERLLDGALDAVARKGTLFLYDYMRTADTFGFGRMQLRELSVLTATGCPDTMERALRMMADRTVDVRPLITQEFDKADALKAWEATCAGHPGHIRSIIRFS